MVLDKAIDMAWSEDSIDWEKYPLGNYAEIKVRETDFTLHLHKKSAIKEINVLPEEKQTWVFISHIEPTEAEVFFKKKKLPYRPDKGAFLISRKLKKGLLEVKTDKEYRKFRIEPGRMGNLRGYACYGTSENEFVFEKYWPGALYHGYLVTNQPTYRPGDTLRLKALVFDSQGVPYTDSLTLNLSGKYPPKFCSLYPKSPGLYLLDLPLTDSLNWRLDNRYEFFLKLAEDERDWQIVNRVHFDYEDYELDESTAKIWTGKESYAPGDSINIFATLEDANGNSIPGGQVRLKVSLTMLGDEKPEQLYLPIFLLKDTPGA